MSAPGWYPDPQDPHQQRFWNGSQWTGQTHPTSPPSSPVVEPDLEQFTPQPLPAGTSAVRNNAPLVWLAVTVAFVLALSAGWWVLLGRHSTTAPAPHPPGTPTGITTTAAPAPSTGSLPPGVDASLAADATVEIGDVLEEERSCPLTSPSARGELDGDGMLAAAGVRMPLPDGFEARMVPYGFMHESNSATKQYESRWMSSVTLGSLRVEEGFVSPGQSVIRVARCILGDRALYPKGTTGTVISLDGVSGTAGTWLQLEVPVTGVEGVDHDDLAIGTIILDDRMVVVVVVAAGHDPDAATAMWSAINQLEFS
ncbi:DUF2510 domain-containing protein [Arachnia propionica]|uniref:DUF2510 domain-containing protein n=1 Tax=Arachnia propionica TaxID=1750 RepID=A0A3P1T2B9_9ACTN|nr:DUF2510 domain-containing protein [Arachnia propionica]RRD03509.1 DUF2510 domain-containing protein [Arachnia propionica]